MSSNPNIFDEPIGLLKRGAIVSYDDERHIISVKLNTANSTSNNAPISVPAPQDLFEQVVDCVITFSEVIKQEANSIDLEG